MSLNLHAIILALNEEWFIEKTLSVLYPFVSGISVITQYDRDWYGTRVVPDSTLRLVADYPDPEGKIHLVVRRSPDEAAARNLEMLALSSRPERGTMSHGSNRAEIEKFHRPPDYFWIVDADEIYDPETVPAILSRLEERRPRGMRVWGVNYLGSWNRPVSKEVIPFCQFGFIQPGIHFEQRRTVSWNESRLNSLAGRFRIRNLGSQLFGMETCPFEVGYFHHGCWLGDRVRLAEKLAKSSHRETNSAQFAAWVETLETSYVPSSRLPAVLTSAGWTKDFFELQNNED